MSDALQAAPSTWRQRPDGSRRSNDELRAEGGDIALRLALLDEAMQARVQSNGPDLPYPPRLFLAYKWGSPAQDAWVAALARQLADRGWDLVFDGQRDEAVDRTVEAFVGRLVGCQVFVAVLSQDYLATTLDPRHPTWVHDEMQCALLLRDQGRLRLVGIVPPPPLDAAVPRPPAEVRMPPRPDQLAIVAQAYQSPRLDELYRLATQAELAPLLDQHLTYHGPVLDAAARTWVAERLRPQAGDAALDELLARHPFVAEAWRQRVVRQRDRADLAAALTSSEQALAALTDPLQRLGFERERIALLKRLGKRSAAAQAATRLIAERPHDWVAHWQLGDLLDDGQAWWAARAHLLLAQREAPTGTSDPALTLAVVYMALGLLTPARQTLQALLAWDPDNHRAQRNLARVQAALADGSGGDAATWTTLSGPLPGCSDCRALFIPAPQQPVFCAACAAPRAADAAPCRLCGADGWLPLPEVDAPAAAAQRCPVCRSGQIRWLPEALL